MEDYKYVALIDLRFKLDGKYHSIKKGEKLTESFFKSIERVVSKDVVKDLYSNNTVKNTKNPKTLSTGSKK